MQNLPSQFNVYDVLSYLIPGFIAVILGVLFLNNILEIDYNINSGIIIFISVPVSFVIGIIFHEFSNIFEMYIMERSSENILLEKSELLSQPEKNFTIEEANNIFGLNLNNKEINKNDSHLIYCLIRSVLKEHANKTEYIEAEIFNINYGIYRNLFAIFLFYSILYSLFSLNSTFGHVYFLFGLILFILTILMYRRANRFAKYHVIGIFRAFLQSRRFLSNKNN